MKSFTIILFKLPDERIALQRRTKDAPYAPDKLAITLLRDFVIPKSEDFKENRHFFLFSTDIAHMDFDV